MCLFSQQKSNVFSAFKIWKVMVENETYLKVKNLQPDNGGKYVNDDFQRYYDENGIKMKRTVSGNS